MRTRDTLIQLDAFTRTRACRHGGATTWILLATASAAHGQFMETSPFLSGSGGYTENSDFGDVDLDGDWDLAAADGGDFGNQLNQMQINLGGMQGGVLGSFNNEAATRFPSQPDDSRDVEFADIDGDGDLDLHVANTSTLSNQSNRWWVNQGGLQGGSLGFYQDETDVRWVGLGQAGSSVSPSLVLPAGGYINWCEDADFADLDNDGDLDLVNSSYGGGAYTGNIPTRLYLNDGLGFFEEFNPSGHQLAGTAISNGEPALWAQGVHKDNTTDFSGLEADIANAVTDIEVGDLDGDFDIDFILGHRDGRARLFGNLINLNGVLAFRDVSELVFPANWSVGGSHWDQELIDLDGDGDLDLFGLNWDGFSDRTLENLGGSFAILQSTVPQSNFDDEEADAVDYDNDGDLDVFVANFSGADRLYRNDGSGLLSSVANAGLVGGLASKDAEAADVDGDGDYDVFVSESFFGQNKLYANITQVPDTTAPYISSVEALDDAVASAGLVIQRAQVYDNTPYYLTWRNTTEVDLAVDGVLVGTFGAQSSYGQIFRTELPGNLVGQVESTWRSTDEFGNVGLAAPVQWTSTPGSVTIPTEFGSGGASATGSVPSLSALSLPFAGTTLYLRGTGVPETPALLLIGDAQLPSTPVPGLGVLNVAGQVLMLEQGATDSAGDFLVTVEVPLGLTPGSQAYAQFGTFDGGGGDLLATSAGLELTIL